jgi:ABC-type nitrate/sulfonate/bicarbonate transport system substrate-binding protein
MVSAVTCAAGFLLCIAVPSWAAKTKTLRFGYLDHPGSALCRIAAEQGHFRKEGIRVELVRFTDSRRGLAALDAGAIDAGAFPVSETLGSIAAGKELRIIAGGGTVTIESPVSKLDETGMEERRNQGIVVSISAQAPTKAAVTQLTAGIIRAYRSVRQHPELVSGSAGALDGVVVFDPNPDYYRLERIWRSLGLQDAAMKRDFLANHVYEEIYCDALDRLLDNSADDPVFKALSGRAVCTPDCCPAKSPKK